MRARVVGVKLIGLTGGIASGKSTVSACLRRLGAFVVDADHEAHVELSAGMPALAEVRRAFGVEVFHSDGTLDRHKLGERVFRDETARRILNAIVHPGVRRRMWALVETARQQRQPAAVLDVPLLIEGNLHRDVDEVWVVYVSHETQVRRLMERNGISREAAERRIAAQMPLDEKRAYADVILDNEASVDALCRQVEQTWQTRVLGFDA